MASGVEERIARGLNGTRAWGDGRVLTAPQRERKRALDRKRVGQHRRQSVSRIAALESEVCRLKATQINADCRDLTPDPAEKPCSALGDHREAQSLFGPETIELEQQSLLDRTGFTNCQAIFNSLLESAATLRPSQVCADDELNQDAVIRGITQGWRAVQARHHSLCPLWRILRLLDLRIFRLSGTITRFCTLRMIHRMLLCLVGATDLHSLPPWYRPRPAQKALPHPIAIDVLPWPGPRERAVLNLDLTSPNRFWNDVIYCFRFIWPHPTSDAVKINPSSRLFYFTGLYKNYVDEISMWTMDQSFFATFPDTVDDIVPALQIEWPLPWTILKPGISDGKELPLLLVDEAADGVDNEASMHSLTHPLS